MIQQIAVSAMGIIGLAVLAYNHWSISEARKYNNAYGYPVPDRGSVTVILRRDSPNT